jgi:hypothetical protein
MMKGYIFATCAAATLLSTGTNAATVVYTDRASFEAAAQAGGKNIQTETFSSASVGNFPRIPATTNFSQAFDGFTITGNAGTNNNYVGIATGVTAGTGVNTPIPANFLGQNYVTWANNGSTTFIGNIVSVVLNFNAATTAFGFDWFNTDQTDQYTLTLGNGAAYTAPPFTFAGGSASTGFFGLVSDTLFTTATITNNANGGYISDEGFDNVTTNGVGSSNPVPEPATWALMLAGFGLVGAAMRTRKDHRPQASFA